MLLDIGNNLADTGLKLVDLVVGLVHKLVEFEVCIAHNLYSEFEVAELHKLEVAHRILNFEYWESEYWESDKMPQCKFAEMH